jgi:hypothetical protein
MNGKPGDEALLDILEYGRVVFTPEVDDRVRELHDLGGFQSLLEREWLSLNGYSLYQIGGPPKRTAPGR